MRQRNTLILCVFLIALITLFCSCSMSAENLEDAEVRQRVETMINALIKDDFETAFALVDEVSTREYFAPLYKNLQEYLSGIGEYQLKPLSINRKTTLSNGQKTTSISVTYMMETQKGKIIVDAKTYGEEKNLNYFYLGDYEKTDYYCIGILSNMKSAEFAQWMALLLNIPIIGFTVFAIVDCCRKKIKRKGLWLFLLILGFVTVTITLRTGGINIRGSLSWIFGYSALLRYGSGTVAARIMIPVAALCYFSKRNSLLSPEEETAENLSL